MKKLYFIAIYLLVASFVKISASDVSHSNSESSEFNALKSKIYVLVNRQDSNNQEVQTWLNIVEKFGIDNFFIPMHFDIETEYNDAFFDIRNNYKSDIQNLDRSNPKLLMAKYLNYIFKKNLPIAIKEDQSSIPFSKRPTTTPVIATIKANVEIPPRCVPLYGAEYNHNVLQFDRKKANQIIREKYLSFERADFLEILTAEKQPFSHKKLTRSMKPESKLSTIYETEEVDDLSPKKSNTPITTPEISAPPIAAPKLTIHKSYSSNNKGNEDKIYNPNDPVENPPVSKIVGDNTHQNQNSVDNFTPTKNFKNFKTDTSAFALVTKRTISLKHAK
ncbi:MAG: hypothetical protein JO129_01450 [Candidatus Dependentiae bacterium]|nr:hypothetical protein [Candidatus Dependentiae bacterium]